MSQAFMSAHVPTMLLMTLVVSGVMAVAVTFVALRHGSRDGLLCWGGGLLLNTVSDLLFVVAAEDPRTWLLVAGYTALSASAAIALQVVLAFFSWRLNRAWVWLPLATLAALSVAFADDPAWSILLLETILAVQFALAGWAAWHGHHPGQPSRTERGSVILTIGMALAALGYAQRVAQVALGLQVPVDLVSSDLWQTVFYVQANAALLFATLGLVLMHKEHAEALACSANERLVEAERDRARLDERRRLLQDVHDGFGSQLATARLRVLDHELDQQQLVEVLRECLDDLHLVIDTLNSPDNTLEGALADYRHRMGKRLARQPVEIEWQIDLDACPPLDERTILQLLRIMQEAFANALKHARAAHLLVAARCQAGDVMLQVVVADDGAGIPPNVVHGRGLDNMRSRARAIGAALRWEGNAPGTRVVLELPLPELSAA